MTGPRLEPQWWQPSRRNRLMSWPFSSSVACEAADSGTLWCANAPGARRSLGSRRRNWPPRHCVSRGAEGKEGEKGIVVRRSLGSWRLNKLPRHCTGGGAEGKEGGKGIVVRRSLGSWRRNWPPRKCAMGE
eukprot:362535-Chlamydomonas_euryale.AAC.8